jgi:hypothetical protein
MAAAQRGAKIMKTHQRKFRIFISYSRPKIDVARKIYRKLRKAQFDPWLDVEDLPCGAEWKPAIEHELQDADLMLVLLSEESITRNGFLQHEILEALKVSTNKAPGRLYLLPVRLEQCAIHQRLAGFNHIDLFEDSGWKRLMIQLKELRDTNQVELELGPAPASSPQSPTAANVLPLRPRRKPPLPIMAFPDEIKRFFARSQNEKAWRQLDRSVQDYIRTVGCKLEPIVQIVPVRPAPVELGFECLGLGACGESFRQIMDECGGVDGATIRIGLAVVAIQTILRLRTAATSANPMGARKSMFTINLDPITLDSPLFKELLHWYGNVLDRKIIFEVNESTTTQYLDRLVNLQADFDLHYAADDLNEWNDEVRAALIGRVELTKMDHVSFKAAMDIRGDDPKEAIRRLRTYKVRGIPLVVEGVQDPDYVLFLERNWDYRKHGELYGQGYALDPGVYWDADVQSLKTYGLPGGSTLRLQA